MNKIADFLVNQYLWDMNNMSQPWMYWCVLPILAYCAFFSVKWTFLTLPLWLPLSYIFGAVKVRFNK